MTKIKIAIAEDHEKARKAVIRLLHLENDIEVMFEAENGIDLLKQLEEKKPDVILMDIRMPVMDGIEAANQISRLYPDQKVIAYSQYDNEQNIIEMYIQGGKSFIGKNDEPEELFKAIRVVYKGGSYMTEEAAKIITRYLSLIYKKDDGLEVLKKLSRVQLTVLYYVAQGLSIKEIASKLSISPNTVNNHQYNIRKKANLNGRLSLKDYAIEIKSKLQRLVTEGHFVIVEK